MASGSASRSVQREHSADAGVDHVPFGDAATALAVLLIASVVIWFLSQYLKPGHNWGDDFGLYLQYALNMVHGRPLNELNEGIAVPPGFPALIAVFSPLHGWNLQAIKMIGLVCTGLLAILSFFLARRYVGPLSATAVSCTVILNGYLFVLQQSILADIPYAVATNVAILAAAIVFGSGKGQRPSIIASIALPLASLAALLIKPAGIALTVGVLMGLGVAALTWTAQRRIMIALMIAVLLLIAVYYGLFAGPSSAFMQLVATDLQGRGGGLRGIVEFVKSGSVREFTNLSVLFFWFSPPSWWPSFTAPHWLTFAVLCGAAVGWAWSLLEKRGAAPAEWFFAAHAAMIILQPGNGGPRYWVPVLPLVFIYNAKVLGLVFKPIAQPWARDVAVATLVGCLALRGGLILYEVRNFDDNDISKPPAAQFLDWISKNTPSGSKICTFKPRAVMYLTQRATCLVASWSANQSGLEYLTLNHAQYMGFVTGKEHGYLPFVERAAQDPALCRRFSNSEFEVYGLCEE